jgi:nucleoside-diphosphate-sugar epimerase
MTRQMNTVLVTGGAGFIGSALVRALLTNTVQRVIVIDNLMTGSRENLAEVRHRIEFHQADIRDLDAIAPLFRGVDRVFHLAALPSVARSIAEPALSHDVNVNGTFNVFRAAAENRTGRVIYAASSSAYGDTEVLPKVESMAPRPKSPYAAQKLMGEYYASTFASCFGLDTVSLRFFNVYGPRQNPSSPYSGVISIFGSAVLERRSPMIFGDGEQTRDFTFVEDVASLLIRVASADIAAGRVYNAGNGKRYSLNRVWQEFQHIEGVSIPALYAASRQGDVRDSQADTTACVHDLGHRPRFSLHDGLRATLEWYRANVSAVASGR